MKKPHEFEIIETDKKMLSFFKGKRPRLKASISSQAPITQLTIRGDEALAEPIQGKQNSIEEAAHILKVAIDKLVDEAEKRHSIPGERQVQFRVETFSPIATHRTFLVNAGVQVDSVSRKLPITQND